MGNFVTEEQIALYKGFVKGIREDLGRDVILHIPGPRIKCPNCIFDPVNQRSTNVYSPTNPYPSSIPGPTPFTGGICPVCAGVGQYTTETSKVVQCLVRELKSKERHYEVGGVYDENDFRLKADISFLSDFESARKIEIDGNPTEVTSIIKRGLRDLIQIVVFCKKSEWPGGKKKDVSRT